MLYEQKPDDFNPKFEVVGTFVESEGEIILLLRQDHKPEGNTYGIPSGKIHEGESALDTAHRETWEETGIDIPKERLEFFRKVYVRFPIYDFVYHIFHTILPEKREIKISESEHKEGRWVHPQQTNTLPLIGDLDECIKMFF